VMTPSFALSLGALLCLLHSLSSLSLRSHKLTHTHTSIDVYIYNWLWLFCCCCFCYEWSTYLCTSKSHNVFQAFGTSTHTHKKKLFKFFT